MNNGRIERQKRRGKWKIIEIGRRETQRTRKGETREWKVIDKVRIEKQRRRKGETEQG